MLSTATIFLLFCMVFGERTALACSCGTLAPVPCEKFPPTDMVFVGTVESIENPPPDFTQAAQSNVDIPTVDQERIFPLPFSHR